MWHALLALLLLLPAAQARAQFYDLDGAYRCLTQPNEACEKGLKDQPRAQPAPAEVSPLDKVVAKVRDKTAGPAEIDFLEKHAAANDPRATEALAWCRLNGLGTKPDAVAAYWLYRQAAKLGVANARRNQIAIYENRLTPEERQQVLVQENAQ